MKQTTRENLDLIAETLAGAFVVDAVNRPGSMKREMRADYENLEYKTDIEFFKMTFRKERDFIPAGLREDGVDVSDGRWKSILKTPYQMNYLANEVCHRLKIQSRKNPAFAKEYRSVFKATAGRRRGK